MHSTVVFCDFDGTITREDTMYRVGCRFAPAAAERLFPAIGEGRIDLREGIAELVATIPACRRQAIADYVGGFPLRPGFMRLLALLRSRGIPLVVLSGGLDFYVEARLRPWRAFLHALHALPVKEQGGRLRAHVPSAGREAVDKCAWMARYPCRRAVLIGDSLSDFAAATAAHTVFARDRLLAHCRRHGIAATAYEDFADVVRGLGGP